MNGKTVNYIDNNRITINEEKNVIINGNGTISGETSLSFIRNYGNLETNEVTIKSGNTSRIDSTIETWGTCTFNNSNISNISTQGTVVINGGEYNNLFHYASGGGIYIINDGTIKALDLIKGGTCTINGGKIEEILLSNDAGDVNLTIGNINSEVNMTNPQIGRIHHVSGTIAPITFTINFYNGIIKECFFDLEDASEFDAELIYTTRPGYKAQTTAEGTILVKE